MKNGLIVICLFLFGWNLWLATENRKLHNNKKPVVYAPATNWFKEIDNQNEENLRNCLCACGEFNATIL